MHHMRFLASLLAVVPVVIASCAPPGAQIDDALTAYEGGKYSESLSLAEQASKDATTTEDSDQAAYIAGMSAFRLGQYGDAITWLTSPARSSDRWMAGQAGVTLGSSYLKVGKRNDAARAFAKAAGSLDGDEAKKAHLAAANAYRELGDTRLANEEYRRANVPVPPPATASAPVVAPAPTVPTATTPERGGAFVLQAGAFKDKTKAQRRADEIRPKAAQAGLGAPTVVGKRHQDGSTLYVVQLGAFPDRRGADAALTKLGVSGVVVGRPASAS